MESESNSRIEIRELKRDKERKEYLGCIYLRRVKQYTEPVLLRHTLSTHRTRKDRVSIRMKKNIEARKLEEKGKRDSRPTLKKVKAAFLLLFRAPRKIRQKIKEQKITPQKIIG